jgi:hypothetical protein
MGAIEIAGLVMGAVGSLGTLAARMLTAKDAEAAEILKQMQAEVDKAHAFLRAGGTLDQRYAASDAKLDAAIEGEKKKQEEAAAAAKAAAEAEAKAKAEAEAEALRKLIESQQGC